MKRALALLTLAAISCGKASPWTELDSLENLKSTFNRDEGKARIVLLLSPT